MALDGIVIHNLVYEINEKTVGGRITRVAQPEADELILTIKKGKDTYKLLLSASAGLPLAYFTEETKQNPATAPNFCMVLRKHIGNGKIIAVTQPGLERIIDIQIEHLDEMGDLTNRHLIVELMGKYSNIILCSEEMAYDFEADKEGWKILDSIKHVPFQVSSVREVLPGRPYFIPDTMNKKNPLDMSEEELMDCFAVAQPLSKCLYTTFTGISPVVAEEIVYRSGLDSALPANCLSEMERIHLAHIFYSVMEEVRNNEFEPNIVYEGEKPIEFSSIYLETYGDAEVDTFESISTVLETYYASKSQISRIRQKTAELRKLVQNILERSRKKYDLQEKQLKDTEKREKYRLYGELLNAYGYSAQPGCKKLDVINYYTGEPLTIPMDPTLSAQENAQKFYEKYNKLKRTNDALISLVEETKQEIEHLESIQTSIDLAVSVEDLVEIRQELAQFGYIKKHTATKGNKKIKVTSKPFHYVTSDGYHVYIGKNNYQNDELTFKFADNGDIWMHAKDRPGSHVIVKCSGTPLDDIPDATFVEAGRLAAYYSSGRDADKVEIDYIQKKHVKRTPGGKPGFVIYHTNYSLMAEPNITGIKQI